MIPLETLDYANFAPLTGHAFVATSGSISAELRLGAVQLLGHRHPDAVRDPFSLTFAGPQGLRLPQGIYRLTSEALGDIDLFITQLGDGQKGSEFEAIFT